MYWGKFQLGLKTPVIKNENKLKEAYGISVERKSLLNTENIEVVIRGKDGYLYKYNSENKYGEVYLNKQKCNRVEKIW